MSFWRLLSTTKSKTSNGTCPKRFGTDSGNSITSKFSFRPINSNCTGSYLKRMASPLVVWERTASTRSRPSFLMTEGFKYNLVAPVSTSDWTSMTRGAALRAPALLRKMSFKFVSLIFTITLPMSAMCGGIGPGSTPNEQQFSLWQGAVVEPERLLCSRHAERRVQQKERTHGSKKIDEIDEKF